MGPMKPLICILDENRNPNPEPRMESAEGALTTAKSHAGARNQIRPWIIRMWIPKMRPSEGFSRLVSFQGVSFFDRGFYIG